MLMDEECSQMTQFWLSTAFIFGGNYHVMNLGPLNSVGQYEYAG